MPTKQKKQSKLFSFLRKQGAILLILAAFLLIRIIFSLRTHSVIWDESVYIGIGKYIYSAGGAGLWEIIRPLGLPLVLGFLWKLGINPVVAGEAVAILFSMLCILFVYLIGKKAFGKLAGLLAAAFLALTPTFFLYSSYIMTEIPSAFFLLAATYFLVDKKFVGAGIFSAVALLFRFPAGLGLVILASLIFIGVLEKKFKILNLLCYCAAYAFTVLPYLVFNYVFYRKYTGSAWHAIFRPFLLGAEHQASPLGAVQSALGNILYYFIALVKDSNFQLLMFVGIFYFFLRKKYKDFGSRIIFLAAIVFMAYFTIIPNKQERYILAFLPFVSLIAAYGAVELFNSLAKSKKRLVNAALAALLILWLAMTAMSSVTVDSNYLNWRPAAQPAIASEFYSYFANNPVSGAVLTTDPVPAAYSNALFIPYYFYASSEIVKYNEWEREIPEAAIIYTPNSFYCDSKDNECQAKREQLFEKISSENKQVFHEKYFGNDYYIFVKISSSAINSS